MGEMKSRLRHAQMRKLRVVAAGGLVATGVALPGLATRTAGAAEPVDLSSVTAVAIASGQRATVSTAGLAAVSDFFDGVGPVTEAKVDGQGGGQSFASLPYPGQTIMQYPAYVALATNGQAVPGYPFYVAANPGEPDQKQGDPSGTYFIEAKAAKDAAGGVARLRGAGGDALQAGSVSTTSINIVDGKLVSTAESVTDGLALGPLKLGSVHSRSVTTYAPGDGEPTTTTELRLDGGVVNDQRFSIGPNGLTVTQQGVPVPVSQGVESLNAALKPQGMSIRFLDPEKIVGGGQSATVEVAMNHELPGGGSGVVRLRVGQVTTAIVPGGDLLSHPSEPAASEPAPQPSATTSPAPGPAPEPTAAADQAPSPAGAAFGSASGPAPAADFTLPTSSATLGGGSTGALSGEPTATPDLAAASPEVAVTTPPAGAQTVRAGRLAATAAPRAVDGVYAAVAWATIAVLALSLIWRQGARKWTS